MFLVLHFSSCRRKRRNDVRYEFQVAHIIVVSMKEISNSVTGETEIELFVLDPTSESPLADKAFKSENLRNLILRIPRSDLPYPLKSVDTVKPRTEDKDDDGLPIPVIAGAVAGVVVFISVIVVVAMFCRRKNKSKKYVLSILTYSVFFVPHSWFVSDQLTYFPMHVISSSSVCHKAS